MLVDYLNVFYFDDVVGFMLCNIFQVFFFLKIQCEVHNVFQVNLGSVLTNKQHPHSCRFLVVCILDKCLW